MSVCCVVAFALGSYVSMSIVHHALVLFDEYRPRQVRSTVGRLPLVSLCTALTDFELERVIKKITAARAVIMILLFVGPNFFLDCLLPHLPSAQTRRLLHFRLRLGTASRG